MPHKSASNPTEEQLLHVLDLPQLYSKPSAQDLTNTLALLSLDVPSWDQRNRLDGSAEGSSKRCHVAPEGVAKYLTSIIASPLRWIEDDSRKEKIWEEASSRLAERSGRSAMPAISRVFTIPTRADPFSIHIHEPSLTGSTLGFKTWAASYLLSKRLHLMDIPGAKNGSLDILELGSGTGLVGIAAAAIFGANVLLTDIPDIQSNLTRNVLANEAEILRHAGTASTAILDWTRPCEITASSSSTMAKDHCPAKFPVIVAADSVYSSEHPAIFVNTINAWLLRDSTAKVIVELPRREGFDAEIEDFRQKMLESGLCVLDEGEESGLDDWGSALDDEQLEVKCWWSVWVWKST